MENEKNMTHSIGLRLFIIGLLALSLLIPAGMIARLINERRVNKVQAITEVTSKWAGSQIIGGPMLTIPYKIRWKDADNKTQFSIDYLHLLPRRLEFTTQLNPEIRYRGIYRVVLYNAKIGCRGRFDLDSLESLGVPAGDINWREAFVALNIPDMRGIEESIVLDWNGRPYLFQPGIKEGAQLFDSGASALVPLDPAADKGVPQEFSLTLNLNGSQELNFLPLGQITEVRMSSPWSDPSFSGAFLPEKRAVDAKGFSASWKVLDLNRNFPQQWVGENDKKNVFGAAFGVNLFSPVDDYVKNMRAVKYAAMFVALTFLIFFLVEVFNKRRIHPIQYLLVGLSLCLFYLLLLSLSEHLGFSVAYAIASVGIVGLIGFYAAAALGGRSTCAITVSMLAALYGFLFILLQNQDYALLIGSIGLFVVMAAVMYLSRKVDWYALERKRADEMAKGDATSLDT